MTRSKTGHVPWHGPVDPDLPPPYAVPLALAPELIVVSVGGALGAVARLAAGVFQGDGAGQWPWTTLAINLTGAFAIGVLIEILTERFPRSRFARLFLGTGFLGGYTTFSALTVEAVELAGFGRPGLAGFYVFASVSGAVLACLLGIAVARLTLARAAPEQGSA